MGKFQGVMSPATPTGMRTDIWNLLAQLGRRRLAELAAALARHVVRHVDGFLDVAAGLGQDLAHLARHVARELLLAPDQDLGRAVEDLAALGRGQRPPAREGLARRRHRRLHVLGAGVGEGARPARRGRRGSGSRTSCPRPRAPIRRRCSCRSCARPGAVARGRRRSRRGAHEPSPAQVLRHVLALVLAAGHVAVAAEHRALGDHDLGRADVAGEPAGGLDLDARPGLAVARRARRSRSTRLGLDRGLHHAAAADPQVAGDADLALDRALDQDVLVAGDLALDRGLGADHAG